MLNVHFQLAVDKRGYEEIFEKSRLVYLTSDTDAAVDQFEHEKVYIIGGIVDHNRLKVMLQIFLSIYNLLNRISLSIRQQSKGLLQHSFQLDNTWT